MPDFSRFPHGVSTAPPGDPLADYALPDPTRWHVFWEDFDNFEADQWVITTTEAGVGSATEAIGSEDGGVLVVTNDDADNDADWFQWSGDDATGVVETFKFEAGKKLFFKARFKLSDAVQSDFVMGLQITDTTPLDVTDGVFFKKDDDDANLDFHVEKNNVSSDALAIATLANDTWVTVAFYYNGVDKVRAYVNEALVATLGVTNLPDDEELTISFGIQNGSAGAKALRVDYIFVAKERV